MKKKKILLGLTTLFVSAALCACGGGKNGEGSSAAKQNEASAAEEGNTLSEGTPKAGGSVVVGMTHDLASLDPHATTDAGTRDVVFNLYEGLVKPAPDGSLIPAVPVITRSQRTQRLILLPSEKESLFTTELL